MRTPAPVSCLVCGAARKPTGDVCDACREAFSSVPHEALLVGEDTTAKTRGLVVALVRRLLALPVRSS